MGDRPRPASSRRLILGLLAVVLAAVAVAGVVHSARGGAAGPQARADALAGSLRCPTCQGLSVKDSTSPMAGSMREIIAEQVAEGRSDDQIRGYFVERYTDWVLLSPPASSGGWLIWVVPVLVVAAGLLLVLVLTGRVRQPRGAGWGLVVVGTGLVVALALQANTGDRAEGGLVTGSLPDAGGPPPPTAPSASPSASASERLEGLRKAVEADPEDVGARLALGAEALAEGRADLVREQSEAVLAADADNVDALLLRSLVATGTADGVGVAAVREFLAKAPADHPGRAAVEGLADRLGVERAPR